MKKMLVAVLVCVALIIPSYAKGLSSKECRKVFDLGGTPAGKIIDVPWVFGNIRVVSFDFGTQAAVFKVEMSSDLLWVNSDEAMRYHLRQGELQSVWLKDGTVLSFYWKYAQDSGDAKGPLNRVAFVLGYRHLTRECKELCNCQ